ncbi:hypothetical protein AB0O67_01340 [Streptomyces sp. NPDC086077]|uniref:hypothetical protein n=1 Tax=Streptomyces sp. NPDC086077 TaxID=3154862 RepID=UPI0034293E2C
MDRAEISIERIRAAVGVLSLVLFTHTAFWFGHDVFDQGILDVWSIWTTGPASGLAATTSLDIGLAALQLAAGFGALMQVRGAGGVLVVACSATLLFRGPVVWYWILDSPSDPWFGDLEGPSLTAAGSTCAVIVVVAVAQAVLLFQARQLEHRAASEQEEVLSDGLRPVKVTAAVSSVLLVLLNVVYILRNVVTAIQVGPGTLADLLAGKGTGQAVLAVSSPWQWACLTVLCGVGLALVGRRRPTATGFSLGLAVFMLPTAAFKLCGSVISGDLLQVPLGTLQSVLELVGSAAVAVLILRDIHGDGGLTMPRFDRSSPSETTGTVPLPSPSSD